MPKTLTEHQRQGCVDGDFLAELNANMDAVNLPASSDAPSAANDPGTAGDIAYDSSYIYVCIATDTWKRAAISTW